MPHNDRLSALLSLGYFPKELPPVFTTLDFGNHSGDIISDWERSKLFKTERVSFKHKGSPSVKLSNSYIYKLKDADVEVISKPKRGYERRNIHITHPIPQSLLAFEISTHWNTIARWLCKQTYSLDKIHISRVFERSIRGINFALHRAKKRFIEATADWLLTTDISRFYPSIYTHSIAWAAYGKGNVKNKIGLYKGSLADRLDILVRNCNSNKTIGIPVGPETSRILAEIISSRIDTDFANQTNIKSEMVDRLQDDWYVGTETLARAEMLLSTISRIYRAYNLEINGHKTSIDRIIKANDLPWRSEMASFLAHKSGPLTGAKLREILNMSLRLQADFPSDPVINYIMSVIEGRRFSNEDIAALESFLLKAATLSPISMDRICRVLLNIQHETQQISRKRINGRFTNLAERNLENGNFFEAIWQIYTIRGLKMALNSALISDMIVTYPGSSLPLILLDMKHNKQFVRFLPIDHWEKSISKERIESDWIWLLAYEGIRKGWLSDKSSVMRTPFFRAMEQRDIVFYNPRKNVPRSRFVNRERRATRRRDRLEVIDLIETLRMIDLRQSEP